MQNTKITLGNESNVAEVLLNQMVKGNVPIAHMVAVVSSIVQSCENGTALDKYDKTVLNEIGYESFNFINSLDDFKAMEALLTYLDEELPGLLKTKN